MKEPQYIKDNLMAGLVIAALAAAAYGLWLLAEWLGVPWWGRF